MTAQVQKLIDTFADWLKHSRELYEMNRGLRDMERVCALCLHKRQCDVDLAAGTSREHYQEYCPNAPTIKRLLRVDPLTVKFLAATNRKM